MITIAHTTTTATECWELTNGWTEAELVDLMNNGIITVDEFDWMCPDGVLTNGRSLVEARAILAANDCGCELCAAGLYENGVAL